MSDIEKIMKINEMTQNLKKHGFAASSEEAASQAQDVFREKIADVEKKKPEEKKPSEEGGKEMASEEAEKMQRNFDVFKSNTQKQIDSIKDDISSVMGKMNEMIKAINELEKLKESVTTIDEGGKEKQQRLAPKVVQKPSGTNHPRSGSLQPGDVDISQTFYYGNK